MSMINISNLIGNVSLKNTNKIIYIKIITLSRFLITIISFNTFYLINLYFELVYIFYYVFIFLFSDS